MKGKIILILPGTSDAKKIENHDLIATVPQASIDDIRVKLKSSLTHVSVISNDLAIIMGNMQPGKGTLSKLRLWHKTSITPS